MENETAASLTDEQRDAIRRLGYPTVPELVEETLLYVRRNHDVALLAGEGSGKEVLYALAAVERCDAESPEPQALVLNPTWEAAVRTARAGYELAGPAGLYSLAWGARAAGAAGPEGTPVAHLVAGRPGDLLREAGAGRLALGDLSLLVVDGLGALEESEQWDAVADILDTLPEETQRIVVGEDRSPRLETLMERQMERPRRWPRELLEEDGAAPPLSDGPPLRVAAGATREARIDRLDEALQDAIPADEEVEVYVHCPDADAARQTAGSLAARGYRLSSEPGEPGVAVVWGEEETPSGIGAHLGLPPGLPALRRALQGAETRVAVVAPVELAHLRLLARRAGWETRALPDKVPAGDRRRVERYRRRVVDRVRDLDPAEMLLLEPLFETHGAPAVAAALSRWVRETETDEEGPPDRVRPGEREGRRERSSRAAASGRRGRDEARKTEGGRRRPGSGWTRLFMKVGERDGVGPGDLVGAITGESNAVGGQIGKIEIRETYSLVEVDPDIADHVIAELSGSFIRGREVHVRRDVKS